MRVATEPRVLRAGPAWAVMVGFIVLYDRWAIKHGHETLSGGCWRSLERPGGRIAVTLAATLTYKHLVAPSVLPQTDPLRIVADRWHKASKVAGSVVSEMTPSGGGLAIGNR